MARKPARNAKPKADPGRRVDPVRLQYAINEADAFTFKRESPAWSRRLVAAYLELTEEARGASGGSVAFIVTSLP